MQRGGCIADGDGANNQNSCADHTFKGADFEYLAANVKYAGTDKTILPAVLRSRTCDGAKVGFIGMTLKDTPDIVTASRRRRARASPTRCDRQRAGAGAAERRASTRSSC